MNSMLMAAIFFKFNIRAQMAQNWPKADWNVSGRIDVNQLEIPESDERGSS